MRNVVCASIIALFLVSVSLVHVHGYSYILREIEVEGFVSDYKGLPISGAEVKIVEERRPTNTATSVITDENGSYSIKGVFNNRNYLLCVCWDNTTTPGLDWIPYFQNINRSKNEVNITLYPAASVILHGAYKSVIFGYRDIRFNIIDPIDKTIYCYNDNNLSYGPYCTYSKILGNESVLIVPAGKEFSISLEVNDEAPAEFYCIPQGEIRSFEVQQFVLSRDLIHVLAEHNDAQYKLLIAEKNGLYTVKERIQFEEGFRQYNNSISYYSEGDYEKGFITLKKAYLNFQAIITGIDENLLEARSSMLPTILFIAISALSMFYLFKGSTLRKIIYSLTFFIILFGLYYVVSPGSQLTPMNEVLGMLGASIIGAGLVIQLLKYTLKRGHRDGLGLYDVLSAAGSMASNNLKRRWGRTILIFITLTTMSMSFVSLTSYSVQYGLIQRQEILADSSLDGIQVRLAEYLSPYSSTDTLYTTDAGTFNPVEESTIEWLNNHEGITRVYIKAEFQPREDVPVIGFDLADPIMQLIDSCVETGELLREEGTCLVYEGRLGRAVKGDQIRVGSYPNYRFFDVYDIGETIYGLKIVGGFSDDIAGIMDINGEDLLPEHQVPKYEKSELLKSVPYESVEVIITTKGSVEKLGGVISRVNVVPLMDYDVNSLIQSIALSDDFRVWSSTEGKIQYLSQGDVIESKGFSLAVPYLITILTVISTILGSMFERKREINILSSIGLNPGHISSIFLLESATIAFTAGSVGYIMGLAVYPVLSIIAYSPAVYQKISAFWAVATLSLSLTSVIIGTLLAIRSSVVLTPSLRRKWRISKDERVELETYQIDIPARIEAARIDQFMEFMTNILKRNLIYKENEKVTPKKGVSYVAQGSREENAGITYFIRFNYRVDERFRFTSNRLEARKLADEDEYAIILNVRGTGIDADVVGNFIRKSLMDYSTHVERK